MFLKSIISEAFIGNKTVPEFQNCTRVPERIGKLIEEAKGSGEIREVTISRSKHTAGKASSSWTSVDSEPTG